MKTLAGILTAVLGLLALPAVMFAFFNLLPLVSDVFVLRRVNSYVPATFELEWARLDDEGRGEAVGTVGGKREVLPLAPFLPRRPTSLNDVQDLVADKVRFDVMYDAGGSGTAFEGRRLRVLPAPGASDLRHEVVGRITNTLVFRFGPAVLLTLLGIAMARLRGGGYGCWMFPAGFFLACLPLFALFIFAVEAFQ